MARKGTDVRGGRLDCGELVAGRSAGSGASAVTGVLCAVTSRPSRPLEGSGGSKAHPALKVADAARTVAVRLFTEFGLTPASRQRVDRTAFAALDKAERFLSDPGTNCAGYSRPVLAIAASLSLSLLD